MMVGTLIEGANFATFAGDIGLSGKAFAAVTSFGILLIGFGAWLSQHGH